MKNELLIADFFPEFKCKAFRESSAQTGDSIIICTGRASITVGATASVGRNTSASASKKLEERMKI